MNLLKGSEFKNIFILLLITSLMTLFYGQINSVAYPGWDLSKYIEMASFSPNINPGIPQPFAYRLLGPFLVGLLPLSTPTNFYVCAVAFSICLVVLFYYILRFSGLAPAVSVATVSLFIFNKYLFGFTLWDYFQINDLLMLNIMIILFLSMWRGQWLVFGIAFLLGAVTKETSMLLVPTVFIFLIEQKRLSANWHKAALAVAPGVVAFILIRVFVPAVGGISIFEAFMIHSSKLFSPESIFRSLVNSFLPFSFLPIIYWKTILQFFETRKYMLVCACLVYFSTLFGLNNERLMAPVFLVFYMMTGNILQQLNLKPPYLVFIGAAGFLASFHQAFGRWPLPSVEWTYLLTFGSTFVVTGYMIYLKFRMPISSRSNPPGR